MCISENVSKKERTPSSFIVDQGIKMWYGKNLQVDEISDRINDKDFSMTAEKLIKLKVVNHCRMHHISYKDLQKIENKLKMNPKYLARRNKR